jgi:hypothetical protein
VTFVPGLRPYDSQRIRATGIEAASHPVLSVKERTIGCKHNDVFRLGGKPISPEADAPEGRSDPIDGEDY